MYGLLAGNIALYSLYRLPAIIHILISTIAIHLAFTIWHEAAHGNVAPAWWLNNVIGIFGIFPYSTPFFIQKHIHLLHHAKMNQKEDPNFIYTDGPFWQLPIRYLRAIGFLKNVLQKDPRKDYERNIDIAMTACVAGIYLAALLSGHFNDLLILWTIPVVFAKVIMDAYVNYLPHAGLPADKYKGTRIVDVSWLSPLILLHNYHAIHHLWPQFPWSTYHKVFTDRKENLIQMGVPIEHNLFDIKFQSNYQTI